VLPALRSQFALLACHPLETGISKVVYEDKSRNVLVGGWSPDGGGSSSPSVDSPRFFDAFHSRNSSVAHSAYFWLTYSGQMAAPARVARLSAGVTRQRFMGGRHEVMLPLSSRVRW